MKKVTVLLAALLCAAPLFAQSYYTGSAGGKETLIAIKVPEGEGLSKDEEYLLTLVQGVLLEDFTRFSDMTVIDRRKLTQLLEETESGLYSENSGAARAGDLEPPRYILSGTLTKTSNYLLSLSITDTKKMSSKAKYTERASRDELDDFSAINKAAEKLLNQMGIKLTAAGQVQMYHVTDDDISAGLTLARGLSASGNGGVINVAEQNYLFKAQNYEQTAAEAKDLLNRLESRTTTGDVGAKIMTDFQLQEEWEKTLNSYSDFYSEHPPFDFYYSVPDGEVINYREKKYKITFSAGLRWNQDSINVMEKVLNEIDTKLKATKKKAVWGFGGFPNNAKVFTNEFTYKIQADVVNGKGDVITSVNFDLDGRLYLHSGKISATCDQVLGVDTGELIYKNNIDLTGLTIRITHINDMDAESAGRDGILKIVKVEKDKWPIEQIKSKWVVAEEKKQDQEKQKTEKEVENQYQKEQRKLSLEDSVFNRYLGVFISGGPYLGPSAGSMNIGIEAGWGIIDIEGSLFLPSQAYSQVRISPLSHQHHIRFTACPVARPTTSG